jgi:hypothetical protein
VGLGVAQQPSLGTVREPDDKEPTKQFFGTQGSCRKSLSGFLAPFSVALQRLKPSPAREGQSENHAMHPYSNVDQSTCSSSAV